MSANPNVAACPEHWQLFELITEGSTELNAHVKQHVESGCATCNGRLSDIQTIERARVMKDEFDAFFDELPSDDAPADEREKFLSQFKRTSRPADRLGRLSFDGKQIAAEIVKLAGEQGIEAAKARIQAIEADPSRGYALLYAAQLAMPKVPSNPSVFVDFARLLSLSSKCLPFLKDKGPAQPVCREQAQGEAKLLESSALNFAGLPAEAVEAARDARVAFVSAGEDNFALALTDFFEGSAATFAGDCRSGWRLLKNAQAEFELYGQENWQGRAGAALGLVLTRRGRHGAAIHFFDEALRTLHPEQDSAAYSSILVNRGYSLLKVGRLDAAKATYAKALMFARRLGMNAHIFMVRVGLATIDVQMGSTWKALNTFERIAEDAEKAGFEEFVLGARLRAAECACRLGRHDEVADHIQKVRTSVYACSLSNDLAFQELFQVAEEGAPGSDLIAHIADYFEGKRRGVETAYRPFRLVVNGN